MERVLSVFLCRDITRDDTMRIARWLDNRRVADNLCEADGISESIISLGESVPPCMLSMRLSSGGPFFMIGLPRADGTCGDYSERASGEDYETESDDYLYNAEYTDSVGFLKLTERGGDEYEITLAVGEEELWGHGIGSASVKSSLAHAFFELRASTVTANIKRQNARSLAIFRGAGFCKVAEGEITDRYAMTRSDFIARSRSIV
ncbi:MAG: GNAT family N-acetyltransferase [Eubacteriales bacterium]